jgi:hypothetical protein
MVRHFVSVRGFLRTLSKLFVICEELVVLERDDFGDTQSGVDAEGKEDLVADVSEDSKDLRFLFE